MANFKNTKNLLQQKGEYARYFDNFRGVDFSSDHTEVTDSRFAYLVNMYKDYKSGQGGAIETIPGFRVIKKDFGKINGIHIGGGRMYVHAKNWLYYVANIDPEKGAVMLDSPSEVGYINDAKSTSFNYSEKTYILDGKNYWVIEENENGSPYTERVILNAYVPTTYKGIDPAALNDSVAEDSGGGYEHEQRNILSRKFRHTYIADGERSYIDLKAPIDTDWRFEGNVDLFHPDFDVYQYGVRLPLAYDEGNGVPRVREGYPNAIYAVQSKGADGINGRIWLCNPPPKPYENTWNPSTNAFDYTRAEIAAGTPESEDYKWPYAYSVSYDGIEVTATQRIMTIGGMTDDESLDEGIISRCTLAAIFDNHIFLSGNPDFPRHIFWNAINSETGVADATYFGQLNYDVEGLGSAPVVALMPIGDSLMVLKSDGDEEESLLIHTAQSTGNDLNPKIYPSSRGHKGIGCLGPCINFRDDPIFLSRFGVDALGHVSTKYRRAIKHRSTLVDAKLLNCDLENASVAEWNGYLLILTEGKIFMADSRQMYNTDSGNTEYEWYYLEDIGVYNNQFDEYVYAELSVNMTDSEMRDYTAGLLLKEATAVRDEFGTEQNLIGTRAENVEIKRSGNGTFYYSDIKARDEYGNEIKGSHGEEIYNSYYVEPTGAMIGGEFDPAVLLKVVGEDLFFATEGGVLCKFNFDMRDPETGLFPIEAYDFNGRAIFSGCATKMDNCGIPHLTKTTVKRSTVIKTRTFEHSGAKVKVRTNGKAFNQIGRIINGQATFNDPDFKDFSFSTQDKSIFTINEREKKWVEKQIFIYSDEFRRPFAIHYLAYRYNVAGRYKE